jgi:hypothetical protein
MFMFQGITIPLIVFIINPKFPNNNKEKGVSPITIKKKGFQN